MQQLSEFISKHSIKGFLANDEGEALYGLAIQVAAIGPCLEIGSYCGKSTVYLGQACKETKNSLYAVDHHRGSEEHQPGEEYHDAELFDAKIQQMNSFPLFQQTLATAQLEEVVIPIVAKSDLVCRHWQTPLGLVFVDGGHSPEMAMQDCLQWANKVALGGIIAVHDIFPLPEQGGQGPYLGLQAVVNSGRFELLPQINSLGIARRIARAS